MIAGPSQRWILNRPAHLQQSTRPTPNSTSSHLLSDRHVLDQAILHRVDVLHHLIGQDLP
jgi:hypothetical protein